MTKATAIHTYTLDELNHYRNIAAKIVAMYGDAYLPVFERMQTEVEKQDQKASIKALALQFASM